MNIYVKNKSSSKEYSNKSLNWAPISKCGHICSHFDWIQHWFLSNVLYTVPTRFVFCPTRTLFLSSNIRTHNVNFRLTPKLVTLSITLCVCLLLFWMHEDNEVLQLIAIHSEFTASGEYYFVILLHTANMRREKKNWKKIHARSKPFNTTVHTSYRFYKHERPSNKRKVKQ